MNWKDSALFSFKSAGKELSRRIVEPILMHGGTYEDSQIRMKTLLDEGYVKRSDKNDHSFELTEKGDMYITPYFNSVKKLMSLVRHKVEKVLEKKNDVEVNGGLTGIYFTYIKSTMFRFHPYKGRKKTFLFVRLPNLIGEEIEYKSNEFYISQKTLERTSFLEDIINVHLKMVDEFCQID